MKKENCYVNRELSWLEFNSRVLDNASDPNIPLCERLNFFSIFQSNLDEFFMVRIGSLYDEQVLDNGSRDSKTGMTPSEQMEAAVNKIRTICQSRDKIYMSLQEELKKQNIRIVRFADISEKAEKQLSSYFISEVRPYLSYYTIRQKHEFPFLNNLDIYALAVLKSDKEKENILAIVPCKSSAIPRLIPVPGTRDRFILLEEFILHYLPVMFSEYKITGKTLLRITRNADIDADAVYDEELNYREHMAEIIRRRKRLNAVRLELSRQINSDIISLLCGYLNLSMHQIFEYDTPLDLSFLYQFSDMLRREQSLFYPIRHSRKWMMDKDTKGESILQKIRNKDILLHYPYDNFGTFLNLLHEASTSPEVTAIRMTLYRLASGSKVVEALAEAAENGKKVEVFVELKARFDEANNIEWSRRLEQSGCKVIYGIERIKVHSKLCLITLSDYHGKDFYITQIGTGNYNEKTSRIYTDFSLMTANQKIGKDSYRLFQSLIKGKPAKTAAELLISPENMEKPLSELIDREIRKGKEGRIFLKLNSLTDKVLIDKLIEASRAGVQIQMLVRGICCLLPKVQGWTDNIRIISIVGRYLEHSRIYLFGKDDDVKVYISSADWMTRNMVRRVEIACPVLDDDHIRFLEESEKVWMSDSEQAWELGAEGHYTPIRNGDQRINAQDEFFREALRTQLP